MLVQQFPRLLAGGLPDLADLRGGLGEAAPGPLQHALDRRGGGAEHGSHLGGFEGQDVAQDEHGPLPGGQVLQRCDQREAQALPGDRGVGGVLRLRQDQRIGDRLEPGGARPGGGRRRLRVVARGTQPGRQRPPAPLLQRREAALVAIRYSQDLSDERPSNPP